MRFQAPQLGALGVTFTAFRAMQFVSLVAIIGITANFINEIVTSQRDAPDVLVGTLAVASIATLYVAISYILYYDGLLPLLIAGGVDLTLLVAAIVVAVTIGKPLSLLKCELLPQPTAPTQTFTLSISARDYASAAARYNNYLALITTDQPHCYEIKAVWGLGIALCVLFAFSAVVCGRAGASGYSGEGAVVEKPGSDFGGPVRQISGPTALGTRLLAGKSPGPGRRVAPPPLTVPEPARRPPILRSIDEDIRPVPAPPILANAGAGHAIVVGYPPASNIARPPPAAMKSSHSADSPNEDFITIVHQPSRDHIHARVTPLPPTVIPPTPSDDGFDPIGRAPPLPRDALGIPIGKKLTRSKSRRVRHDDDDDTTPLSPGVETQTASRQRPKRKTLWGVIEGWWDLGLLERGKSLRGKAPYNGL
ncbi:Epsin-3, clathrin recruitment and traffic between the Golgi and endosome [Hypoxylon texense]